MARRLAWLMALTLLRPAPTDAAAAAPADVVFRVPGVQVRHASSHKSVGTRSTNDSEPQSPSLVEARYEEYFVEHEISTVDARRAAKELNLDAVLPPHTLLGCGICSRRDLEYCETRMIADHCCCEPRYFPERFSWVPHTCYIGPNQCRPLARNCVRYARIRDCCCYRNFAERWKSILSSSCRVPATGVSLLLLSMLLSVAYL